MFFFGWPDAPSFTLRLFTLVYPVKGYGVSGKSIRLVDTVFRQSICLIYLVMYARISHLHCPLPYPLAGGDDIE